MIRDTSISPNKDNFRLEEKREHEITSTEFLFYILIVLVIYLIITFVSISIRCIGYLRTKKYDVLIKSWKLNKIVFVTERSYAKLAKLFVRYDIKVQQTAWEEFCTLLVPRRMTRCALV